MEIARVIEKKKEEEEDLIEIRTVKKIVPRQFHKYFKVFKKKELERMLIRKTWDHTIDLREYFVLKKGNIYLLSKIEREGIGICKRSVEKEIHLTIKVTANVTSILCAKEGWKEENGTKLLIFKQLDN